MGRKKVEKIKRTCDWCEEEFEIYPSRLKKHIRLGRKKMFCGHSCKVEWNKTQEGYWSGKKMPFYKRPNRDISGSKNPNWKGGRRGDRDGYILIYQPHHPNCDKDGYVREHRLVMEKELGRFLTVQEVVHHEDGDKQNNKKENLRVFGSEGEHQKHHYENGDSKHLRNYKKG
jgi:hypothetical protein